MLSENLMYIGNKYKLPQIKIDKLGVLITNLRRSDVLTTSRVSREVGISFNDAEEILTKLFEKGILKLKVRIACKNDEPHYKWLDSMSAYFEFDQNALCEFCEANYDFKKAKVAFTRGW